MEYNRCWQTFCKMENFNYRQNLLKVVTKKDLKKWLQENPMPKNWKNKNKYAWAYENMPF